MRDELPLGERAFAEATLARGADVLDIATGNGALAISAGRAGFACWRLTSAGMARELLAHELLDPARRCGVIRCGKRIHSR